MNQCERENEDGDDRNWIEFSAIMSENRMGVFVESTLMEPYVYIHHHIVIVHHLLQVGVPRADVVNMFNEAASGSVLFEGPNKDL